MKYILILSLFLLSCTNNSKPTIIYVHPPNHIEQALTKPCDEPNKADSWMVLTEHFSFKCPRGLFEGSYKCYGWYIKAYVKCKINGLYQTLESDKISFGNFDLHKDLDE